MEYIGAIRKKNKTTGENRMKMTFEQAIESVKIEREHQDLKWGTLEEKNQSVAGYLVILEKELEEAKNGWMKNKPGKDSALAEIRQIAAVAMACIQQHGIEGN
jgi:hypothetical protein